MMLANWLLPCVPLQTQAQEKHKASTAPSPPLQLMSIPLAPRDTPVFPENPLFSWLFLVFFSWGKGEQEVHSVPWEQGNAGVGLNEGE